MKLFGKIFISLMLISGAANATIISRIDISGNSRLDSESVRLMLPVKVGDNVGTSELNVIIKSLQASNYFETVAADMAGDVLKIKVSETPVVGMVTVEGNDAVSTDDIKKEIRLSERNPFSVSTVGGDVQRIITIYQRQGFFETKVVPEKIARKDNRVDVIYKITEGYKTVIKDIDFEGNKAFSNRDLRGVILSREYTWWNFMTQFDVYDSDRIDYDMQLLRQFYLNNGYADIQVSKASATLTPDRKYYSVKFKIVEGKRFKFGVLTIDNPFPDVKMEDLTDAMTIETGDIYSRENTEATISKLRNVVAAAGYAFVQVDVEPKKNDSSLTIDLKFVIKKSPRLYLNDISITGNVRTFDDVINHSLLMRPKDPFSLQTIEQSRQRLMRTQYFKSVDIIPSKIENSNLMNLNIKVEEQPTGELSGGLGWSNVNGFMIDAGITERNFMGRGQTVSLKASTAQYQDQVAFSFTEPYLFNRALSGGFDINYTMYDYAKLGAYGYDRDTFGITGRLGWLLTDRISQSFRISTMWDKLLNTLNNTSTDTSLYTVGTSLKYSNLDTDFQQNTHTGVVSTVSLSYTGFGSTEHFARADYSITGLLNFFSNRWQLKSVFNAGYIDPLNEDGFISRPYRYFLGGETLRGFESAGIGSANWMPGSNYAYGGLWKANGTTQLNFPVFIPDEYQVKGFVFMDYGVLGRPPEADLTYCAYGICKPNHIDQDWRVSYGFGVYWNTPMGPMNFSWGYPLVKKSYDREQKFLLSFETQF